MTTVIKAENISKQYLISHQKKARYSTFSESLSDLGQRMVNKIRHPFHSTSEDEIEVFSALTDINFEIKQGDRVGIIGRNGAGKSTLLKLLSRITEPTTGAIGIKGRVASLLEVGTGFHPELSGRENIYLNGAILGMTKRNIQAKFDEIVAFSEVEKFLDTPVKRYSSGMRVRLAFSVAAHLNPDILIIDEVLAVGDTKFQQKCIGKINAVSQQNRTVVFVSHNMTALKKLCEKSLYLENGHLIDYSSTDKIIHKYQLSLSDKQYKNTKSISSPLDSEFILKKVLLCNGIGDKFSSIESGDSLSFKFHFQSKLLYSGLQISIGLDSLDGERVGYLNTQLTDSNINLPSIEKEVTCTIQKLSLVPGDYFVSLKIMKDHQAYFWLPKHIKFTVTDGDFFGTGKLIQERWVGKHYIEHFWE